jgi:hypothetical protein
MTDTHRTEPTRRIEIPERTAQALAARLERSEFESVDAYAAFALELLVREAEGPRTDQDHAALSESKDSEDGVLEDRLESLGYL